MKCNLTPLSHQNILTVTDELAEEFQFDDKEFVTNQGPLEALHMEQKVTLTAAHKV